MTVDGKEIKYLYIATTNDRYELPIAVADSTKELAEMLGMKHNTVSIYMCGYKKGFYKIPVQELIMDEYINEQEVSVCDTCEMGDVWECQFCCSKCLEDYGECPDLECNPMDI